MGDAVAPDGRAVAAWERRVDVARLAVPRKGHEYGGRVECDED